MNSSPILVDGARGQGQPAKRMVRWCIVGASTAAWEGSEYDRGSRAAAPQRVLLERADVMLLVRRSLFNRRPVKSPLEKVLSDFCFSKSQFLGVVILSQKNVGSSLDHLAAVFYSQKKRKIVL